MDNNRSIGADGHRADPGHHGAAVERERVGTVHRGRTRTPGAIRWRQRLRQVLLNLLSNAIKFTDSGEVLVTVHTGGRAPTIRHAGLLLHFTVIDTGIGIPLIGSIALPPSARWMRRPTQVWRHRLVSPSAGDLPVSMGGEMWVESSGVPGDGAAFHHHLYGSRPNSLRLSISPHNSHIWRASASRIVE